MGILAEGMALDPGWAKDGLLAVGIATLVIRELFRLLRTKQSHRPASADTSLIQAIGGLQSSVDSLGDQVKELRGDLTRLWQSHSDATRLLAQIEERLEGVSGRVERLESRGHGRNSAC